MRRRKIQRKSIPKRSRAYLGEELLNLFAPFPITISKKAFIKESKLKRFVPVGYYVKGTNKLYYLSPKFRGNKNAKK